MAIDWLSLDDILRDYSVVSEDDVMGWVFIDEILIARDPENGKPINWEEEQKIVKYVKSIGLQERERKPRKNTPGPNPYTGQPSNTNDKPTTYNIIKVNPGYNNRREPIHDFGWRQIYSWLKAGCQYIGVSQSEYFKIEAGWNYECKKEIVTKKAVYKKDEVERLIASQRANTVQPPYLTPGPYYSSELAAMVNTWTEIFDKKSLSFEPEIGGSRKINPQWQKSIVDCLEKVKKGEFKINGFTNGSSTKTVMRIIAGKDFSRIKELLNPSPKK